MPRKPRVDFDGAWHHVYNRGLAKRPVFEQEVDFRTFKALLALSVRRREIEVHAYSLLNNHFHLLVRSRGQLSRAMNLIENRYVRIFNWRRDRDGALFRGRFGSKLVESLRYREVLVSYIDSNPVEAGIASRPETHRHGSAFDLLVARRRPWLSVQWLESSIGVKLADVRRFRVAYRATFQGIDEWARSIVECRATAKSAGPDRLDHLLVALPARMREHFIERAHIADRTEPMLPVTGPDWVVRVIGAKRRVEGAWGVYIGAREHDAWQLATIVLLRELASQNRTQIARRLGVSVSLVARSLERHRDLCGHPSYTDRLANLAAAIMEECQRKW